MATLHLVLAAILLASTHAQSDFCEKGSIHHLRTDVDVREEGHTQYFENGIRELPRETNVHDVFVGDCSLGLDYFHASKLCIEAPSSGNLDHIRKYYMPGEITCVRVLDRQEDGTGAIPVILDGGVGNTTVVIQFTSQERRGIRFLTEIHFYDQAP